MPKYSFTAKSQKGESYSGTREARDEIDLARTLHQDGYVLISAIIEEIEKKRFKPRWQILPFLNKVSLKEKMMLTRNLQVMIGAGVSLPQALESLAKQSRSKKLAKTLEEIAAEILKGETLSNALAKYPNIFSELFYNMVKVGEESGTLEKNLGILAHQMEREQEFRSKIQGAMIYPAVIVLAMIGIGIMMLIMVVPKLAETFEELSIELPLTTRIVIGFSAFLAEKWYLVILLLLFSIFAVKIAAKNKAGKRALDKIFLKVPIISPIIQKTNSLYTIRTLSFLIASGVPLVRCLEIISGTLGNFYFKKAIKEATEKVEKGGKLSEALAPHQNLFAPNVIQMIEVGEETGATSDVLEKLGNFFDDEITLATKNLAAIIEPLLMLIVGGAVGFFAISMIQPMYSMLQGIK